MTFTKLKITTTSTVLGVSPPPGIASVTGPPCATAETVAGVTFVAQISLESSLCCPLSGSGVSFA
ncbi:hypothetical protein COLO4_34117 [Corchorus olitorius]|uniref:Uncharacterized protein n=1 Tax=Corchorus olitorius TaxID=93759 RepID=A0A1R3GNQ9_9ROSI|nr:hypothetical protein COLO4_34117 [Corchorus olitorius]